MCSTHLTLALLLQAELLRVEQQLALFQRAIDAAEEGAAALRGANAALAAAEAQAAGDAAHSVGEARRLAAQVSGWMQAAWGGGSGKCAPHPCLHCH